MKREGSDGPLITAWNLRASDADARRTSEYWKAEHIACDAECERLRGLLREVRAEIDEQVSAHDGADPFGASCPNCAAGVPVAHSLACRIDAALRGKESE